MKKRILVVDDDPDITLTVKLALESRGAYAVFEENDARSAMNTARKCDPDLIILDIMMPRRSGIEVAADLREDSRLGNVPILFLTALDSREASHDSIPGASQRHYLAKPFDLTELIKHVEALGSK